MRACLETLAVAAAETAVEDLALALQVSEPRAELALAVLEEDRLIRRVGAEGFELRHLLLHRERPKGLDEQVNGNEPGNIARNRVDHLAPLQLHRLAEGPGCQELPDLGSSAAKKRGPRCREPRRACHAGKC